MLLLQAVLAGLGIVNLFVVKAGEGHFDRPERKMSADYGKGRKGKGLFPLLSVSAKRNGKNCLLEGENAFYNSRAMLIHSFLLFVTGLFTVKPDFIETIPDFDVDKAGL